MTAYTWPTTLIPYSVSFYKQHHSVVFESPLTRTKQVLVRPGDRYVCSASFQLSRQLAGEMDALLEQIKGPQNTVYIWPFNKPEPQGDDWDSDPAEYLTTVDFTDDTDFTDTTGFIYSRDYGPFVISTNPLMLGGFAQGVEAIVPGDFLSINGTFLMVLTTSVNTGVDGELGMSVNDTFSADYGDEPDFTNPQIEMRITSDDAGLNTRSWRNYSGLFIEYNIDFVEVLT